MRVAVTLEQCWHDVPGGTATAALDLVRALDDGQGLELVGVSARHRRPAPGPFAPPVPTRQLPLPRLALYEAWHWARWPPVERAVGPVDLIHATGTAMPPPSVPLVVTVHDLFFRHRPELYTRRGVAFFTRALELTRTDATIVCASSGHTMRECVGAGIPEERLRLVPLGVERVEVSDEDVTKARIRYGLDRPFVLWNGTIEPRKNVPALVRAFAALGRDDLDLVLLGPRGWKQSLQPIVADMADRVKLPGFVPADHKAALHAAAEVFCLPSLLEGFGLPVLEAMMQGTPVVTSAGTATEELVADGAGVVVDPTDVTSITDGLRRALDDAELRRHLAVAGPAVAAEYSWARTASLTRSAYDDALVGGIPSTVRMRPTNRLRR